MKGLLKVLILLSLFLVVPACSSSRRATRAKKRIVSIDVPRYGKNSLYFSKKYQRKLKPRGRKIRKR